jgi:2,3-bisphosphoglycerate-independent phosphoglycerate mutase
MNREKRPLVLIIRDGWGRNPRPEFNDHNAVHLARTPNCDELTDRYPWTLIHTSGPEVGLPEGTVGNSEVGHQNIGAGRVVDQESVRINKAIEDGNFFENKALIGAIEHAKRENSSLHLLGLASDAGVHALLDHLYALLDLCSRRGLRERVYIHAFTDGRDTSPYSGEEFLSEIERKVVEIGVGELATVCGRYYAMDRDNRWARVEKAYRLLTLGEGRPAPDGPTAAKHYYEAPSDDNLRGDEFVSPTFIVGDDSRPRSTIKDGDSVIFFNFRGDRPRELVKALTATDFAGFDWGSPLRLHVVTLTSYEEGLAVQVAFPKPPKTNGILGAYIADLGLRQFRCAETEKYPHVTYFFNDYREEPFAGEERLMPPSPRVATYDQTPEMSASKSADAIVDRIERRLDDLLIVNFANGDMVGHTGRLSATIKAIEVVDTLVGRVVDAAVKAGGHLLITADHGNAEQMIDPKTGGAHTAHTLYNVELIAVDERLIGKRLKEGGRLADVAPTALAMMGLDPPGEMTGESLLE